MISGTEYATDGDEGARASFMTAIVTTYGTEGMVGSRSKLFVYLKTELEHRTS